jgi:hypothetical protein
MTTQGWYNINNDNITTQRLEARASTTTTTSQHQGWSIIISSTRLRVFNMRLASQHEAGYTISSS